ncbi:hypothetical protein [Aneurinibacillus soli]|nr:hypothetical protein [Aneurinibacillus soli]
MVQILDNPPIIRRLPSKGFLQSVVEERDRAGPRHFGTLTEKW